MKTTIYILTALILILASCESEPLTDFIMSSSRVEVYENIYLTNTSSDDVEYFEWDFGDGTWSDAFNASHYYEHAGVYQITLTSYNGPHVIGKRTMTVEVLTTSLVVIVEEYYKHYRIADASVILYPTENDWDFENNPVAEGYTDANGVVTFENLNPVVYFIDVWHPNFNNYKLAAEDIGWIATGQLYRNEVNEFIAYVDEVGTVNRKEGKKLIQYKLIKTEPRIKKYVQ